MFENIDVENPNNEPKKEAPKTDNIFKELSQNLDFWEVKEENLGPKPKTTEDYLKQASVVLGILNIFFLFLIAWVYGYIKIQNNPDFLGKTFLDPVCFLISMDEVPNTEESCSSVAALIGSYNSKSEKLQSDISTRVLANVDQYYAIEDFIYSKEVSFLLDRKASKLRALEILWEFDKLRNNFVPAWDKKVVQCIPKELTKDGILSLSCEVFSPVWFAKIPGSTWDNRSETEWTSMTVANSFLNYIDKNIDSKFKIVDEPKGWSSEPVIGVWWFSSRTVFEIKLQYSETNNTLSL